MIKIKRAVAALTVAAVFLAMVACGDDGENKGTASPTTTTTATEGAASPAGATSGPQTLSSSAFEVPLSLNAPAGFELRGDVRHAFFLQSAAGAYLVFLTPTSVSNPVSQTQEDVPDDFVSWLASDPRMEIVDGPSDVTVGGLTGQRMDVKGSAQTDTGPLFFAVGEGDEPAFFALAPGELSRIVVVDVNGQTVVITGGDPGGSFEAATAEMEQMLKSVAFE